MMEEIFGLILYSLFDVIFFGIGKFIIKTVTFGHTNISLDGKTQPLASLIGLLSFVIMLMVIIYFVRN